MYSLKKKLGVFLVSLFLLLGAFLVLMVSYASEQYYQEITQRLNAPIAMYVASEKPLITSGQVNEQALKELAHHAMIINPGIEIYLLDTQGEILSFALPEKDVKVNAVELGPIKQFLSTEKHFPLRNTNPGNPAKKTIFSVAPVEDNGQLQGYVYVILAGKLAGSLADQAGSSYVLKLGVGGIVCLMVFFLLTIIWIIGRLTKRLNTLKNEVVQYQFSQLEELDTRPEGDEIDQLCDAFMLMRKRIDEQIDQIQQTDQSRRDLIGNVSHDLRTPITSMQGYVETLLLQSDKLTEEQRQKYMQTVYKHCVHIDGMVGELFELSRLDSHAIKAEMERFSLSELLQDIAHEFQLKCDEKSIQLNVHLIQGDSIIVADIRLIQRVFENLLSNAIRHTPSGGKIELRMKAQNGKIECTISDTGKGIVKEQLAYIFDRLYQADATAKHKDGTLGLGLAIVKRILDLHNSQIKVQSQLGKGTEFTFAFEIS